jgi:hypothetical protein
MPVRDARRLSHGHGSKRRGAVIVLALFFMVAMLGMCAFGVDLGYISSTQTELRRAVDAGALAGAGVLVNGTAATTPVVREYVKANRIGGRAATDGEITVQTGFWDSSTKSFSASNDRPSAVRVFVERKKQPLFFARIFGRNDFDLQGEAIAQYQPRDIMLALDFSASMNDDSTFAARSALGQAHIEANLQEMYNELGQPTFGNMSFTPVFINSTNTTTIKNTLGLNGLAYPCLQGSWTEFINHVKNDTDLYNAGYRKKYGVMTLLHYWLKERPSHDETPALASVSAQPVAALKDSTEVFLSFLQSQQTDDRLGLAIYNSEDGTAILESPLTDDYNAINTTLQDRQAGHYDQYTNIGAGLHTSRLELQNHARPGAFRMIILMTDGLPNRPTNEATGRQYVLNEAAACASAKIPVVSISLGAGADAELMQEVADTTGGYHFNIPGGQTGSEYEQDLLQIFGQVAASRPLRLVQ